MKIIRIGINGFGRIGRIAARIILSRPDLQLSAINSRSTPSSHAYLLKYDSSYGILANNIKAGTDKLFIDNNSVSVYSYVKPEEIPWNQDNIDIVIDSSGKFRTTGELTGHLKKSVKYVVLSAPAHDSTSTLVMGVNHDDFNPQKDKIVSNSSCTTNCLATVLKILHENFQVVNACMTTTHAATDSQNLLDNSNSYVRLRRGVFDSIIPASTGSAKDIVKLFPALEGKISCQALRVPIPTVSLINLIAETSNKATAESINSTYQKASQNELKGILSVARDELVSIDYKGSSYSSIVDPFLTSVLGGKFINLFAWYDNEWGYASRLIDLVRHIGKSAGLL